MGLSRDSQDLSPSSASKMTFNFPGFKRDLMDGGEFMLGFS